MFNSVKLNVAELLKSLTEPVGSSLYSQQPAKSKVRCYIA